METIDLSTIPNELNDAVEFLKGHIQGKVRVSKHQLLIDGPSHKELKLLLHKFLRHKALGEYRVLSQAGKLEIVSQHSHHEASSRESSGTVPPVTATMPYYFPGGSGPTRASKKVKKRRA